MNIHLVFIALSNNIVKTLLARRVIIGGKNTIAILTIDNMLRVTSTGGQTGADSRWFLQ